MNHERLRKLARIDEAEGFSRDTRTAVQILLKLFEVKFKKSQKERRALPIGEADGWVDARKALNQIAIKEFQVKGFK